ncbi:MAG: DNA replication and repair protein RecF [Bacteroidota bacterium]|nr:DNA replication and repair protein RecF [Bacteroidota bacterium]
MKPLAFRHVSLVNFKNYANASFELGKRFNLIHGLNGTGKTNLLDGLYYLCVGKSYFTSHDAKVVRNSESYFRIEGSLSRHESNHEVVLKVRPGQTKEIIVDDTPHDRLSDHLGFIPVVISAPKDIELVTGHSIARRKYIDHLLCQLDPQYLKALMTYNHLLHLRNAALKQNFSDLKRMIDTYDEQMSPYASYIFMKRKWMTEQIEKQITDIYKTLSEEREDISIEYESDIANKDYHLLADMSWELDRNTQRSNTGIHKDDFNLQIKNLPAKEFGSQGQIKSLIFSLHLSKYHLLADKCGFQPLLILDDIFDKLDERRLARLMEMLIQPQYGQILLTDTSRNRVGGFVPTILMHEISMGS